MDWVQASTVSEPLPKKSLLMFKHSGGEMKLRNIQNSTIGKEGRRMF